MKKWRKTGAAPWDWAYCCAIGFGWDVVVWDEAVGREAKVLCNLGLEYSQWAKLVQGLLWFCYVGKERNVVIANSIPKMH